MFVRRYIYIYIYACKFDKKEGVPFCEVANILDCEIVVSEFEFQSCYNVHLRKV